MQRAVTGVTIFWLVASLLLGHRTSLKSCVSKSIKETFHQSQGAFIS